jgi:N utilization substance protein B
VLNKGGGAIAVPVECAPFFDASAFGARSVPDPSQIMKSSRRIAREFAVQGVYEWLLAANEPRAIELRLAEVNGFDKADRPLLDALLNGAIGEATALQARLTPFLDRSIDSLSPVERAVLLIAAYELVYRIETPYRVVINEAVELAKIYGGTDGHKYVNGVLDKLAAEVRSVEVQAGGRSPVRRG